MKRLFGAQNNARNGRPVVPKKGSLLEEGFFKSCSAEYESEKGNFSSRRSRMSRLVPEDNQPEDKSDPQRSEDRLSWILSHILLSVFFEGSSTLGCVVPNLPAFRTIVSDCLAPSRFQIFSGSSLLFLSHISLRDELP